MGWLYFVWLQSEYGEALIKRNRYGAVVDELDVPQMASVAVPTLHDEEAQREIGSLALRANELRYHAYILEQQALNMLNRQVLGLS